ncbi:MAG: hypothetical protein V4683_13110, partial [Bacteroidota bacterium]
MNYSPGILSVLPLFYIGWSDSVLSPSELAIIRNQIQAMDFLTDEDKGQLIEWTNPKNPPSEETFRNWISQLTTYASELDDDSRNGLVNLGINIAKQASGNQIDTDWDSEEIKTSIQNLERALRVDTQLSELTFYHKISPKHRNDEVELESS